MDARRRLPPASRSRRLRRAPARTLDGDGATIVRRVGTLEHAAPDAIAFLANPKYRAQLATTRAAAVIVAPARRGRDVAAEARARAIRTRPTRRSRRSCIRDAPRAPSGIHAERDRRRRRAHRPRLRRSAPYAVDRRRRDDRRAAPSIGAGLRHRRRRVDRRATRVLHANVVVYPRCVIGARTVVHAGAVIGADGFGMAEDGGPLAARSRRSDASSSATTARSARTRRSIAARSTTR